MACKRNRIELFSKFLEDLGIEVNICKNKARGNKGFFKSNGRSYRIDVASGQTEEEILSVLVHEFVHYVHYSYDRTLKSLDFIFDNYDSAVEEDLLKITVDYVPQKTAKNLLSRKECAQRRVNDYYQKLKKIYSDIKKTEPYKELERRILSQKYKYLLKYDRVKIEHFCGEQLYSIELLKKDFPDIKEDELLYLNLKSAQRAAKRINSGISRLNRYYSSPGELLAKSFEYYITKPERMQMLTPKLYDYYNKILSDNRIKSLSDMVNLLII